MRNIFPDSIVSIGENLIKSAGAPKASDFSLQLEQQLIQKASAGDTDAFASLYDAHVDEMYRYISYRVGNEQTAEDLTSQLFLKAWDSLDRYQARGLPFSAWLFRVARNLVIDYYRTHKETVALEPNAMLKPDPAANVAKEVENKLQGEWLRAMLQHLTPEQREVLTLKFINGLSTKEVAQLMNKGQGAIRALQMRGLQTLAELLSGEEE